ncbi:ATP-binding protein [Streptomyces zaomyceticus]|uniref:ATP-binding protein n=1 Tax=Streptomyces zaomyceticus TaxID=68286 RepID=UPI0036888D88
MGDDSDGMLGGLLEAARDRAFVGRTPELALFGAALAGDPGARPVHYVHGPGGIGKSTLLRQFARTARRAGRSVVEVDGRTIVPTPKGFAAAVGDVARLPRVVLLVDTFERCQGLEGWLREQFLPELPQDSVVVVAGRRAPDPRWTSDPGWSDLLHATALRNLPPADATTFLNLRGVRATAHASLLSFTGGNPLALTLAATVVGAEESPVADWKPEQDVISTLLGELLGDVPSIAHRRALEICAHTNVTSEALLRALMGQEASDLFVWLRQQPFIETTGSGVFPHDVVREALEADLRWRDPGGFAAMHQRVHHHLFEQIRTAPEHRMLAATGALFYLYRQEGLADFHDWRDGGHVGDHPYTEADREHVLRLTELTEGPESAAICRFWLDRQPEAFRVYRATGTGEIVAFFSWLKLREPVGADVDPAVDAAWTHARAHGPLRSGEHLGVARFLVYPPKYQRNSAPMHLMHWQALGEIFRADRLAWSVVVMRDNGYWNDYLERFAMPRTERPVVVEPHTYALFCHDWRGEPVRQWLEARSEAVLSPTDGARPAPRDRSRRELVVLSRPEFDTAVRDALRSIRRQTAPADNALSRSRLVAEGGGDLAEVIRLAVDSVREGRSGEKHRQALVVTYLKGVPTQEAAAERLGLPFSTYRRHLTAGIAELCDLLWHHELTGSPVTADGPRFHDR